MLQIATGRFFGSSECHEHHAVGVLYSNYTWIGEIVTSAATLVPADPMFGTAPTSWVVQYVNRMEKAQGPGNLVRTGDAQLVEQFQLLCLVGLGAFFHVDRDVVSHTCRAGPTGQHDQTPPSTFVDGILEPVVAGTTQAEARFKDFIDQAMHLPRSKYKAVVGCARAFSDSLVVASYNIHLAYSMLVYALESLSQQF